MNKEIQLVVKESETITIINQDTLALAVEQLSKLNKTLDRVEEEEAKVIAPMKEAMKAEQARWLPLKSLLKPAIADLRAKMGAYQTEQAAKAQKEKDAIAKKAATGRLSMTTALKRQAEITTPEASVVSTAGMVKFRKVERLVIENPALLPREYLIPDEKAIKDALKGKKQVPGARLVQEQVPMNFR